MQQDWLFTLLREPDTGETLQLDTEGQQLVSPNKRYPINDGVPMFVETKPAGEGFDYTAHYKADAEIFDYFEEETDPMEALHQRLLHDVTMRQVPREAKLLLDVGCGSAFVARHFCPLGIRVVSMDVAPANTAKALKHYPFANHAAVTADAYHLPFADDTFDCIVASEIIEHTVNPQGFLESLLRKVKPGGTLVVSTPYKERIAYSLCIHCNCKTPHNAHLHSFDREKMRRLIEPLPATIESMHLVGNKLILRSHLAAGLSHLGMGTWRACDNLANRMVDKTYHFVTTLKKQ